MIDNTIHIRKVHSIAQEVVTMCEDLEAHILNVAASKEQADEYRRTNKLGAWEYVKDELTLDRRKTAALRRRSLDLTRALADLRRTR